MPVKMHLNYIHFIIQIRFLINPTAMLNPLNDHANILGIHKSLLCLCFESDAVDDLDACSNSVCNNKNKGVWCGAMVMQ